jgi:arylformamidase
VLVIADGASVNLTTLTLSAHTGAHADAPYHFAADGATLEQVDLAPYWGPAQVVTVARQAGALTPEDFAHVDLAAAPRLLVRSMASSADPAHFPTAIVYPGPALIAVLAQHGIVLYGADAPSMDAIDSKTLPGHHALRRHGIAILEGLDLTHAPDGLYELAALPLKIASGDGSPVRAVLRTLG